MKKVLLCDADGTILDSREWLVDATIHTLRHFGSDVPRAELLSGLACGKLLSDFYQEWLPGVDIEKYAEIHFARQRETTGMVKPFEGVCAALNELYRAGVKLGIVTSRRFSELLLLTLRRYELDKIFRAIICLGDVSNPKPDPEGIFLAMDILGVSADRRDNIFIVGDTALDIQAGRSAGIKTIGALYGFSGEELRGACADHCISTFPEILSIVLN